MVEAEVEATVPHGTDRDADLWRGLVQGAPEAAVTIVVRPERPGARANAQVVFRHLALPFPSPEAGKGGRWSEVVRY